MFPLLARTPQELSASNVTHSAMENIGFLARRHRPPACCSIATSPAVVFAVAAAIAPLTSS